MVPTRCLAPALLCVLLTASTVDAQTQSSAQQSCVNGLNKAGANVAATQAKRSVSCLKDAGLGHESDAQACLTADPKLAVAKAAAKTTTTAAKKCAVAPDFGRAAVTTINGAAQGGEIALVAAVFGPDLGAAAVRRDTDKNAAGCQLAVAKAYERLAAAKRKRFLRCKKDGLQSGAIASAVALAGCFDTVAADSTVAKAAAKLAAAVATKCAGVSLATVFPGACAAAGAFAACVDERVECQVCLTLDAMDALARDCDLFDDGALNGSCASLPATPTATPTPTATLTAMATPTVTATPAPSPTSTCGGSVYAEDFTVANGSPWPAPWTAIGSVDVADVQTGRARFRPTLSGYSLARLAAGLDESDVEARFTVEFENIDQQGVGFYVRQNGGYLQQSSPHGQGYAVFVEGFRGFQGIGVWREVDGVEQQLLIDMGHTIANGTRYRVRFQVQQATAGTTALRAKMWPESGMEPAGWDVEYTDNAVVLQGVSGGIAADAWSSLTTGGPTPAYTFIDDVEIVGLCE